MIPAEEEEEEEEEEEANKDKNISRNYNDTNQQFTGTKLYELLKKKHLKIRNSRKQRKFFAGPKLLLPVMRVLDACCLDREMRRLYNGSCCCVSYCTAYFIAIHTRRGVGWGVRGRGWIQGANFHLFT